MGKVISCIKKKWLYLLILGNGIVLNILVWADVLGAGL